MWVVTIRCLLASLVLGVVVTGSLGHPRAEAAPLPDDWCAPTESATDLPDVVAGPQIHVVYAYPTDAPNRAGAVATPITRDLAGVDSWWQTQDLTRSPRFDFADFPGCDSRFGTLDITTLPLANPSSGYGRADTTLTRDVRAEIAAAIGTRTGKAYLVYLDAPVSADDGRTICGITAGGLAFVFLQQPPGCSSGGGLGTGNGWPARTAAHEIVHLVSSGNLRDAPHVCPDDVGHICDPGSNDIIEARSAAGPPFLSQAVLDPGRDDYYGHGRPGSIDARSSELLARLDEPQQPLSVTVAPARGGQVASTVPGIACPPTCSTSFDARSIVDLVATAAPGYTFREWTGDCAGSGTGCTEFMDGPRSMTASFDRLVGYEVRVRGGGSVSTGDVVCSDRCSWEAVAKAKVELIAQPSPRHEFVGWSGDCTGEKKRCRITVAQRTKVTADFARK